MALRVLVDATSIPPDRGGVGRYLEAMLPALSELDITLAVITQPRDAERMAALVPRAEICVGPSALDRRPVRLGWEQTGLPALAQRWRAQVLHSPHYTMPLRISLPVVVTLHDATFFSHANLHSPVKARFFRAATRIAVRRAAALVVPSAATAAEVLRYAGGAPEKFHVSYHGVDSGIFRPANDAERERVHATLGIGDREYVAFLGTLEPRKNVPALVRGWTIAARARSAPPALILAGGPGWDDDVDAAMAEAPAPLVVRRTGYLPLGDLAGFLSGALVVAYPSLGEGFGLPVLESMACGAPVLTSTNLSLPEVGGDAVAYCGTSKYEIAGGLSALLDDPSLRSSLRSRAIARAATFTWEASAAAHLMAYRAAYAARSRR